MERWRKEVLSQVADALSEKETGRSPTSKHPEMSNYEPKCGESPEHSSQMRDRALKPSGLSIAIERSSKRSPPSVADFGSDSPKDKGPGSKAPMLPL
eukprot:CAMPEP_0172600858 /NCGR_PEP_ID=MMETSP1068-20121228/21017_1 /TAXON_ID=35684 /ORGANISM="Pseudopedinella elastica, Strain CCMP716" /LENGTH=96 /DNA_ID=CAMNT_0013401657 /DNA_START=204 /DNA_END=494 /DNA_ORIENTATION=+